MLIIVIVDLDDALNLHPFMVGWVLRNGTCSLANHLRNPLDPSSMEVGYIQIRK
jgi:hypothetical protein